MDLNILKLNPSRPLALASVIAAPKVCSIPLLQMTPPGTTDRLHFVEPGTPMLRGDTVQVPAPACTNRNAMAGSPVFRQPSVR